MKQLFLSLAVALAPMAAFAQDNDPNNDVCSQFVGGMSLGSNTGTIISNGDVDFYQITVPSSGVLQVTVNAVLGAAFNVAVYPANCGNTAVASAPLGSLNLPNTVEALVCGGLYYVRIARQTGTAPIDYTFDAVLNSDDACECNNTFATACEVQCGDIINAALRGSNSANSWPQAEDIDWYRVDIGQAGVIRAAISSVAVDQQIIIEARNNSDQVIASSIALANGADVSVEALTCDGIVFLRVFESSGIGNPYTLSADPYQLVVSCITDDACECNNTFATACEVQCGDTINAALRGSNNANSWPQAQDIDWYRVDIGQAGVLRAAISSVAVDQQIVIEARNSSDQVIASSIALANGADVSVEALTCDGIVFLRVFESSGIGNPYTLSADPYQLVASCITDDACECNNTFGTACEIQCGDIINAALRGSNNTNSWPQAQDIDWYRVDIGQAGVIRAAISSVAIDQQIIIEARNSSDQVIASSTALANGADVSVEALTCDGIVIFRVLESSGIGNPYTLSADPYQLVVSCDVSDICECNNTFQTACDFELNTTNVAKLHGINTSFSPAQDRDFYRFDVACDTLRVLVNHVNGPQRIRIALFDGLFNPNGTSVTAPVAGANVSIERVGLAPGQYYLLVEESSNIMSDSTYAITIGCGNITTAVEQTVVEAAALRLFPNPTNGQFTMLRSETMQPTTVQVFDALGQVVQQAAMRAGDERMVLDLSGREAGIYFAVLQQDDGSREVLRVVKE